MPAPARWAAAAARWPAPGMVAEPAITATLAVHLWAVAARGGSQPRTSAASTTAAEGAPTSRPMSATDHPAGPRSSRLQHEARLQRRERHRPHRGEGPSSLFARGAVDAARDVDGEHRRTRGVGRVVLPSEAGAVGRVDDEVGRRQPGRGRLGVDLVDAHPAASEPPRRRPPVGPVVALPRQHDHAAPVATPEERQRVVGHRRAGPLDEHLDRLGGRGVDRRHLLRGEDRDQSATAMASANRWVWVIVSRHDRMPRSSASSCARPCSTIDGAPLSARATSISRQPQAPIPTPSPSGRPPSRRSAPRSARSGRGAHRSTPAPGR